MNIVSCTCKWAEDRSLELPPCGTPALTTTEGYLLAVDEPSRPLEPSRSSGMYSYVYDHRRDRLLRCHSNSRPSSVPHFQAPVPPGHTPSSSPLIPPHPSNEGVPRCSNPNDEYLKPESQTPKEQPVYHYETIDDEKTDKYDDVE